MHTIYSPRTHPTRLGSLALVPQTMRKLARPRPAAVRHLHLNTPQVLNDSRAVCSLLHLDLLGQEAQRLGRAREQVVIILVGLERREQRPA